MNTREGRWEVQIEGDSADLEHLALSYVTSPLIVAKYPGRPPYFRLQYKAFDGLSKSGEVLEIADPLLEIISGALLLAGGSTKSLKSSHVYFCHPNESCDVYMHIKEAIAIKVTGTAVITAIGQVTDGNGNLIAVPEPPASWRIANLGLADDVVGRVLSLISKPDALTWVGLYRIHEMVESDIGGEKKLVKMGWGSTHQLKRFKHSANSVAVAGDSARHGRELGDPPRDPMSIDEAIAYCKYLLQAWFDSKRSVAAGTANNANPGTQD